MEEESQDTTTVCSICFDDVGNMKSFCLCKNIETHERCLIRWINTDGCKSCKVCLYEYNVVYKRESFFSKLKKFIKSEMTMTQAVILADIFFIIFGIIVAFMYCIVKFSYDFSTTIFLNCLLMTLVLLLICSMYKMYQAVNTYNDGVEIRKIKSFKEKNIKKDSETKSTKITIV